MSDEGFREVQLTGKKLVFLFMVGCVVLVVIFLLGVMVGRGVPGHATADAVPAQAANESVPAGDVGPVPPPTKASAGDLDYAALVGGGDAKKTIEPPAVTTDSVDAAKPDVTKPEPPAKPEPQKTDTSKTDPVAKTPPVPAKTPAGEKPDTTAKAPDPTASASPGAAATTGQWVVQINAYSKKTAADSVVTALKKKNYAAFVAHDGALYHVQVGPFTDKAEAERTRAQLQKEGYKPLIKR